MKYKALALDLDGTLTDNNKKLPERNKEAIFKAIEKGVSVILASGRPLFGITPIAKELDLSSRGGYILAYNGGQIIDCKTGECLYEKVLPRDCMEDVCKFARENGVYALTYEDTTVVCESDEDPYVIKEAKCNYTTVKKVESLIDFVDYPVAKFLVVGEHTKLLPVQKAILEKYEGKVDAFFSEEYFLEVVPANVAKDESLKILLEKIGLKTDELIACGDGMNDIPMLKIAGLSVVMANGYDEVKKYADVIAPSNEECGVAQIIEDYIL
jgi:Cof subfamily protein (haloacid dehalogenase superfamily)